MKRKLIFASGLIFSTSGMLLFLGVALSHTITITEKGVGIGASVLLLVLGFLAVRKSKVNPLWVLDFLVSLLH